MFMKSDFLQLSHTRPSKNMYLNSDSSCTCLAQGALEAKRRRMFIAWVSQMRGPEEMKISNTCCVPIPRVMLRFLVRIALNKDATTSSTEKTVI